MNEAEEGYTTQKLEELSVFPVLQNSCPHLYAHKNIILTTKLQLYRELSQGFLLCFCDDIRLRSHELQELLEIHLKYHRDKETDACLNSYAFIRVHVTTRAALNKAEDLLLLWIFIAHILFLNHIFVSPST